MVIINGSFFAVESEIFPSVGLLNEVVEERLVVLDQVGESFTIDFVEH